MGAPSRAAHAAVAPAPVKRETARAVLSRPVVVSQRDTSIASRNRRRSTALELSSHVSAPRRTGIRAAASTHTFRKEPARMQLGPGEGRGHNSRARGGAGGERRSHLTLTPMTQTLTHTLTKHT